MEDYNNYKTADVIPNASAMIETFRAIGYNFPTAIADIVDNSIAASAKNIWINFKWDYKDTWFAIHDDGVGMSNDELLEAMRPGSRNPLVRRDEKDLGRFGLGLKTASFSQARMLSVISKKENYDQVYWTWDLDFIAEVGEWKLINYIPSSFINDFKGFKQSGTVVLWSNIDRLFNSNLDTEKSKKNFFNTLDIMKSHLSMVFHRYISSKKLNIFIQGNKIDPWDPFLSHQDATQIFPEEKLMDGKVKVRGYVLPHKSKIDAETYKLAEGTGGWNEQQGFYIYRNDRLLLAGDWLGLFRKEEHYKLARIQIDIPNTLDNDWQIDIKKSVARPPTFLRDHLKSYAMRVRSMAVEVYRHRGKTVKLLPGQKFIPLWVEHKQGDLWKHKVNREHPIIQSIKLEYRQNPEKAVETLLRFIEDTIPTKSIYIKESETPDLGAKPLEGKEADIEFLIRKVLSSMLNNGMTQEEAYNALKLLEPFNHYPHIIDSVVN